MISKRWWKWHDTYTRSDSAKNAIQALAALSVIQTVAITALVVWIATGSVA
jgi:hypothetical protein